MEQVRQGGNVAWDREVLAGGWRDGMDEVMVGLAALERTPLFAGLSREHLEEVLRVGGRVSFDTGQAIVERGDPGDAMYIMVSGAAEVDVGGRFHRLERGDFFGEMAVLAGKPREATVKAVEPVEALRIPADDFQAFLLEHPQIALGMLQSLVERLREVQDRLDTWIGGVW
jgi:CRP-like cAMP-binding protein